AGRSGEVGRARQLPQDRAALLGFRQREEAPLVVALPGRARGREASQRRRRTRLRRRRREQQGKGERGRRERGCPALPSRRRRLCQKYTGSPSSRMPRPVRVSQGCSRTVLTARASDVTTKRMGTTG